MRPIRFDIGPILVLTCSEIFADPSGLRRAAAGGYCMVRKDVERPVHTHFCLFG